MRVRHNEVMASVRCRPTSAAPWTCWRRICGSVFGTRLQALVAYGLDAPSDPPVVHSLGLVDRLTFDDLAACVPLTSNWHRRGLAVPLLLEVDEFRRTLDAFPLEYGEIIADHVLDHRQRSLCRRHRVGRRTPDARASSSPRAS